MNCHIFKKRGGGKSFFCGPISDFFYFGCDRPPTRHHANFCPIWPITRPLTYVYMFICYKTSTLNISKQRFWEHILRRVAILEAEQTQGSIPMIFLNNYIYPPEPPEQIWTFRKTLVIIRGLSYGIRELHDRTLKDHTGNNRSKSWFSV